MKASFPLRKLVALLSATMMVFSFSVPAFAKSADSAMSVIEDKTDDADQLRRDNDLSTDLDTTSEINNYFDELINLVNDVEDEIKAVTTPVSSTDFDKIDNAYDDFTGEVDDAVNQADDLVTGTTNRNTFESDNDDLDDEINNADDALDTLRSKITGSSTTGSTTSATVNSVVNNINDAEDNVNNLSDDVDNIDNSSDLNNFFDDLTSEAADVVDELRRVTGSISATDLDNLENAVDDFKREVDKRINQAEDRIDELNGQDAVATVTEITSASNMKVSVTTEGTGNFGACPNISIGTPTSAGTHTVNGTGAITTSTTSIIINTDVNGLAKGDTIQVTDGTDTLSGVISSIDSTTRTLSFSSALTGTDIGASSTTKNVTVTTSASILSTICSTDSDFNTTGTNKTISLSGGDLTGVAVNDTVIVTMNSSTSSTSLQNEFNSLEDDYRGNEEDDIDTQMDRITNLATGTTTGSSSALVQSIISNIQDSEDDVNSLRDDEDTVDTTSELQDYFEDLISFINDVEDELKRVTGTITQADFDDLSDAVDSFKDEAKKARNDVEDNSSTTSYGDEFDNQDNDYDDAINDMEDALDAAEAKIGTVNPPSRTSFFDVFASSEFAPYINSLAAHGVVNGYPDGSFRPKNNVTRAEFLKMAILAKGLNVAPYQNLTSPFVDVPMGHSLRPYVNYAAANGIANGQTFSGVRYFYPERSITRAEAVIILMRIAGIAPGTATSSRFIDVRDAEQIRYIEVAATRGIVRGYNASVFGPNDNLTREQAAKVVALTNGIV